MAIPPTTPTQELWHALEWHKIRIQAHTAKNRPIIAINCPKVAGLYSVSLTDGNWWQEAHNEIVIKASKTILDNVIEKRYWNIPVLLTIGRTTNLSKRIEQHFGRNSNNNRLLKRLQLLFRTYSDSQIRKKAITGLEIRVTTVQNWTERFLLEKYGCAVERPIIDFEAEH